MAKSKRTVEETKTGYILRHATLNAADLVAQGKRDGISLTSAQIHTTRSNARRKASAVRPAGRAPRTEDKLTQLRRLIVEVGYDAASEVLAGVGQQLGR